MSSNYVDSMHSYILLGLLLVVPLASAGLKIVFLFTVLC